MPEKQLAELKRLLAGAPVALYRLEWREGAPVPEPFRGFGLPEGGAFVPVFISDFVRDVLGYEPDECLSMDWWFERVHPEDLPRVLRDFGALMRRGEVTTSYRFRKADGGEVWIDNRARVLRDEGGFPREIVGWWQDATRGHEREQFFRQVARLLPDGVIVHQGGRVVFANRAAERMFDDAGNWLGLDIRQRIHPDFQTVVLQRAKALLTGQRSLSPPWSRSCCDGTVRPFGERFPARPYPSRARRPSSRWCVTSASASAWKRA